MTTFVALLRAVNVGGTGKLPMASLTSLCEDAGFTAVRTYIASGNVVFESGLAEAAVKALIEARLLARVGKTVAVMVRTAAEMAAVLAANPFSGHPGNRTVAIFLDAAPPADAVERAVGVGDERVALGVREIHVAYGAGMGESKLRIRPGGTAPPATSIRWRSSPRWDPLLQARERRARGPVLDAPDAAAPIRRRRPSGR